MNGTYTYTVRAYRYDGQTIRLSDYDETGVSATTAAVLSEPVLESAESGGYDRIVVTWNGVGCASGYEIYRKTSASAGWSRLALLR